MPPTVKRCPHCEETKPAAEFRSSRSAKTGLQSWCKACQDASRPVRQNVPAGQLLVDRLSASEKQDVHAAVELVLGLPPRVRSAVVQNLVRLTEVKK